MISGFIITFLSGALLGACAQRYISESSNDITKKHRDIKNWLKSELRRAENSKLTKNIDQNKVRLLRIIVNKLEK